VLSILNSEDVKRLQRLQNRCMRVILNGNRCNKLRGMLEELDWMNVVESMRMNLMIFVYKLDCGLLPSYFA
jgi:small nuclear ribonucleoprotein (snRNP)-like protein